MSPRTLRSPARRGVGLHPPVLPRRPAATGSLIAFRSRDVRPTDHSFRLGLHPPTRTTMPSADFSNAVGSPYEEPSPPRADTPETSRGKFDRLRRTPAESTPAALDGYGLRGQAPARPTTNASIRILSIGRRLSLPASFGPRLTATPLRFARTSPPSGCAGDLHPRVVEHARHTLLTRGIALRAVRRFACGGDNCYRPGLAGFG